MKNHTMSFAAGVGCATVLAITMTGPMQDAASQDAGPHFDVQQMMQDLQTAHANPTEPGPFHEVLGRVAGEWDVTVRISMGPGMPAMESTGSARFEWALGKRWMVEHLDAELNMGGTTMPLDSVTYTGYDNYRNVYVGAMFSGMSTEMIPFQGGLDPSTGTYHYYGTMHEPMLNITGRMIRFSTTFLSDDHFKSEVYDLHAGEDYKALEFEYTRK